MFGEGLNTFRDTDNDRRVEDNVLDVDSDLVPKVDVELGLRGRVIEVVLLVSLVKGCRGERCRYYFGWIHKRLVLH